MKKRAKKLEKNIAEIVEELIKNTHITVKKGKKLPWDTLVVKDILYLYNSLTEVVNTAIQQTREEERKRIEILLKWLFEETKKYQEEFRNKGMYDSVGALEYVKQIIQELWENPKKIDWIVNNSSEKEQEL